MPAFFGYVDYTDDGRPFYVGKAVFQRVRQKYRNRKHTQISERFGFHRDVEFASSVEQLVFNWERTTISRLGTLSKTDNIGCNNAAGGQGASGWKLPPELRAKKVNAMKEAQSRPETNAKRAASLRAFWAALTPEERKGLRTVNHSQEAREARSVAQREACARPEVFVKRSEAQKVAQNRPEVNLPSLKGGASYPDFSEGATCRGSTGTT